MFVVETYPRFSDLPRQVPMLFEHSVEQRGLFISLPWFSHLAASGLEGNAVLRLYGVHEKDNGNPALMLPMREVAGRYGVRRLEGLSNWYSSLYGIVGDVQADRHQAINALMAAIAAERPRWDVLDLHPLDPADPCFAALLQALHAAGMATQRYFCFHNWYLDVAGRCYDDYAAGLPSRLKNTLKRKGRQLEKSGRARFDIVTGGEHLESAIAAYEAVYRASWKSPEPSPDFMPGLMRLCANQGWLRLGIATVDGEPAAAQLWIVCAGVASIYKLAYDERFASLSIGSLLTERLMRHVIDTDRVGEVDYLTGDDAYKRDWMSHSRERCGIIAFNLRSVRGIAAATLHLGGGWLKTGLRRLRGVTVAP
jgi:CelD/BcsL family acetyltransferase involved in cellulose biosynthesis